MKLPPTSSTNTLSLAKLTSEAYDQLAPVQWPVPKNASSGGRFFADGNFYHPDSKAKMLPIQAPAPKTGLIFNTGRIRDQWHTMTRTGKSARLGSHMAEPYIEVHPLDADAHHLKSAHLAKIRSAQGDGIFRVLITDRARRGQIFVPMHWTRQTANSSLANASVAPVTDPISGQPALKGSNVDAEPFHAKWYGYLATSGKIHAQFDYCAVSKTKTGWQAELAGLESPQVWEDKFASLIGSRKANISQVEDQKNDQIRLAAELEGEVVALLFIAPTPVTLSRQIAIQSIGTKVAPMLALAGVASVDMPDHGAIICSCENVGTLTIQSAISGGAHSVDAIGKATCAGTNCGSCRPELQAMLAKIPVKIAAE